MIDPMVLAFTLILLVLFILSAFFSSAETVLFSLTPRQLQALERARPSVARRIDGWQKEPSRILSTILAGNTLVNFAIASLGYMLMLRFVATGTAAVSVATFTLLLLVFGEILPKQYAMRHAERMAPFCVRMLLFWRVMLKPFSALMVAGSRVFGDLLARERRTRPRGSVDGGGRHAPSRPLRAQRDDAARADHGRGGNVAGR